MCPDVKLTAVPATTSNYISTGDQFLNFDIFIALTTEFMTRGKLMRMRTMEYSRNSVLITW